MEVLVVGLPAIKAGPQVRAAVMPFHLPGILPRFSGGILLSSDSVAPAGMIGRTYFSNLVPYLFAEVRWFAVVVGHYVLS